MSAFQKAIFCFLLLVCFAGISNALDIFENKKLIMRIGESSDLQLPKSQISVNGKQFEAIALKDLLQHAALKGDDLELVSDSRTIHLSWEEATQTGLYIYFPHPGATRIYGASYRVAISAIRIHHRSIVQQVLPIAALLLLASGFFYFQRDWQRAVLLFAFTATIYWQFDLPGKGNTSDNLWYVPTSLSILHQHNLELTEYRDVIREYDGYGIRTIRGAPYNLFPVGTSIVTLPLVMVGEWIYRDVSPLKAQLLAIAFFAGRLIAALSVALLFLLALKLLRKLNQPEQIAFRLALLFAFGTTQFGIHGGGLWSHNVALFLLLLGLLCLQSGNSRIISLAAVPLALAYITRPTSSVHVVLISFYIFLLHRKSFALYVLIGAAIAAAFAIFSFHVYHSILPPYYSGERLVSSNFAEAFAANLISPNRGLLIFAPVFLASFYGMYVSIRFRSVIPAFFILLTAMVLAHSVAIAMTRNWWAGITVGPRYFSDILPGWILLLIPAYWGIKRQGLIVRRIAYSAFAIAVSWSVFAQVRTATSKEVFHWNQSPVNIGLNPERVWDWHDMQILRTADKRLQISNDRPHPNILLITIDTLRADHLGCYGYSKQTSPVIDQLAAGAVRFENAFSAVPLTLPSHATILSGLYPNHHAIRDNAYFPAAGTTLVPEILKDIGYQTAAIVSGAPLLSTYGLTRGFDLYDDTFQGKERKADITTAHAVEWLRSAKQPFFLWVHYFDPHAEYDAPEPFKSRFADPYDGEIAFTDHEIQTLLNAAGEQTVVILTADHGESLGEHGEKTHGVFLYNATLRVPLIVRSSSQQAKVRKDYVSLTDVAPTILEAAGAFRKSRRMDGDSLFGRSGSREIFAESLYASRNFGYAPLFAVLRDEKKFIDAPQPEFYDLGTDPSELRNVFAGANIRPWSGAIGQYQQTARTLKARKLTPEEEEKLRSLGYTGGGNQSATFVDPKTKIAVIEKFNDGLRSLKTGNFLEAEKRFAEISKTENRNAAAFRFLGDALAAQGKLKDAAAAYQHSLQLINDPEVAVQLAKSKQQIGDTQEAESLLTRLTKSFPDYAEARYELASLYASRQQWDAASALLKENTPEDSNQRGILFLMQQQPQRAISEFQNAIAAKPNPKYWNNLGIAYQRGREFAKAESAYSKALQLDPNYEECEANLAFLLIQESKWLEAESHLMHVTKGNPKLWQARMALGFAVEKQGETGRAIEIYQQLLSDAPHDWAGRAQLEAHLQQLK